MKTIEKTAITDSGLTIKVKIEYGQSDKTINVDGDIIYLGTEYFEFTSIYLIKDGKNVAHTGDISFFYTLDSRSIAGRNCWADDIKRGAYARLGDQLISKATYEAIAELLDNAKSEKESIVITPAQEKIEEFTVNPAYLHMSRIEIKAAEENWDNLQNEGTTEGYNPYRV